MNHIEKLKLFLTRVEELSRANFLNKGGPLSLNIKGEQTQGINIKTGEPVEKDAWSLIVKTEEPEEEDVRSYLVVFRHFISEKEPIYLNRIYNMCQQYIRNEKYKGFLVKSRNIWKDLHKNSDFGLIMNGKPITPEYATDLWLNGYYFHNDSEKKKILDNLDYLEKAMFRIQFLNYVFRATRQIQYVGKVVNASFSEGHFE